MKLTKYFFVFVFVNLVLISVGQSKDSTITFKVSGACEMCKQRIEIALKVKGVRSAQWDVNSKMLTMTYNPASISFNKVNKILTEAGHDTEIEKAKDVVYNELPACCHYRDIEK